MPAPIQEKHHPSPVTSGAHTLTFDTSVTSGSAIIACVAGASSVLGDHSVVISDDHGNVLDEVLWHVDSGGRTAIQYATFGHVGGSTTVTFTWTRISTGMPDTIDVTCGIIEAPVGGVGSSVGSTSGNSTTHQASDLTNVEDDALFLCCSNSGTDLGAITPGDGYTGYFNTDALIVNYKSVSAVETNDASFTSAVTGRCSHAFVVYEGVFTPVDCSTIFGENGDVASSRTVLFNLDGVARTIDDPDTVHIWGTLKVNGVEAGSATVADDSITNAKLADMAQATIKGRASGAGTGDPSDLSANQVSTILDAATDPFARTSVLAGGGAVKVGSVLLSHAQIAALNTTPVEVVAAPGAGFGNYVMAIYNSADFSAGAYSDGTFRLRYDGSTVDLVSTWSGFSNQAQRRMNQLPVAASGFAATIADNKSIKVSAAANPTSGNAANTWRVTVIYVTVALE